MVTASIPSKHASQAAKPAKVEKPKHVRVPYLSLPQVKASLDGNGRLSTLPVPFVPHDHVAPRRTDFAGDHVFMRFRADIMEARGRDLVDKATKLRTEAISVEKIGDPTQRAKVKKLQRMRDMLSKLEEQLKVEGITVQT